LAKKSSPLTRGRPIWFFAISLRNSAKEENRAENAPSGHVNNSLNRRGKERSVWSE
jgi:hypothetical protein